MKISVVTSCFNAEEFVRESIESVLNQSYPEIEYILVDDGSTDGTLSILKKYSARDERILVLEKQHSGLSHSLNTALQHAKGLWIARLDADDIAMPDRIEEQVAFVKTNEDIVLLGGGCIEIDARGNAIKKHSYPSRHVPLMHRLEKWRPFFPHSSVFFKKSHVERLGGYRSRFVRSQDLDLWFRIGETGQIACLQTPVIRLRKHLAMASNTHSGRLQLLMGMAATVCHYRRRYGLMDPAAADQITWERFLQWIHERMEEKGFFGREQGWQRMRGMWHSQSNRVSGVLLMIKGILFNEFYRKAVTGRVGRGQFPFELAKKSVSAF